MESCLLIHRKTWNNPAFRTLWAARWETRSKVPKQRPRPPRGPLLPREQLCLTMRHRFKKVRVRLLPRVVARFGGACAACGDTGVLVLDHVLPIAWGGTNDEFNLQPLCNTCNSAKGGRLPVPPGSEVARCP